MNVVIVDDARMMLSLEGALVKSVIGQEPLCFTDPRDALEWCRQNITDLLITDFSMPELDGAELVRQFRELPGNLHVPVLMVTGSDTPEVRNQAMAAGVSVFLGKPFPPQTFVASVRNILDPHLTLNNT